MPLPEKFVERILHDLGLAEGQALCASLDGESPVAVRCNPFKNGTRLGGEPIGWSRWGVKLAERPSFTNDTAFHAGCYYVQEAGSQFVGHILECTGIGGGRILDMCAAPGGKTTLYAAMAGPDGLVVANEPVRNRTAVLADNVRKWGLGNTAVTCNEPRAFEALGEYFDVVAVDAPCSGEGMFRKDERARSEWNENNVRMCAVRQSEILDSAWRVLKPEGVLIYSTCTFNRTENEEQLQRFAAKHDGEIEAAGEVVCKDEWGIVTGREGCFQTFRFYPHRTDAEGFFAAVARKSGTAEQSAVKSGRRGKNVMTEAAGAARQELARWVLEPDKMRFASIGESLYGFRASTFDEVKMLSETVNVVCSGVEMGRIFDGRLKPAHPLAMFAGLDRKAVAVAEIDRTAALQYLRKEPFDVGAMSEGMNLIVCDGCALGFAKRIGNRCNNSYPNSLRILKG